MALQKKPGTLVKVRAIIAWRTAAGFREPTSPWQSSAFRRTRPTRGRRWTRHLHVLPEDRGDVVVQTDNQQCHRLSRHRSIHGQLSPTQVSK